MEVFVCFADGRRFLADHFLPLSLLHNNPRFQSGALPSPTAAAISIFQKTGLHQSVGKFPEAASAFTDDLVGLEFDVAVVLDGVVGDEVDVL